MDCLCRPSRLISVRVVLLDDTDFIYELKDDLPGQTLLDVVYARLDLVETTYFGIRYIDDENQTHWLDPALRISRQLKPKLDPFDLYFGVKFYAADPCKLVEEITRYQIFLQVRQDVLQGRLPVSFELAAELGAFVVQSELGDYDPRRNSEGYVSEFRLLPNQTNELETRVSELHQQLKGMTPATAELNYLEKVKWHDMYGVDLHPVLGEDSVEYFLGLTPSGIVVLRSKTTVAHYYWSRITKAYYKGRYFMLRISDKNNELSTYGFETPRKSACKHLWRCCVEHHAFFRLVRVAPLQSSQSMELFTLGSRFRYSGRTEKQVTKDIMSEGRTPPTFTRIPSKRQPRRMSEDFLNEIGGKSKHRNNSTLQHIQGYEIPYRSTYSIPTNLGIRPYSNSNNCSNVITPDSPRSTRSAPWPRSQQRGLFGNSSSPRSVRSANFRHSTHVPTHSASSQRFRSSSVESHSSNDSRSTRRNKHRYRRTSDNESELSRGSGRSGRSHHSHRKYRRSRHRRDSGSENDSTRRRTSSSAGELIDSKNQWREVQRRQADGTAQSSVQQASVSKSSVVARSLHHNDSHSDTHSHHKSRRHRKNKSPSESRSRIWSSELAKHLQFDLVDTTGMTEDQLREIPYTVIETNSSQRLGSGDLKVHKSNSANKTNSIGHNNRNRVDRIRGLYFQTSNPNDSTGTKNGSIRSASTMSSRECEKNSGLVRMMSSMSMGDFISPTGSNLSPLENSALRVSHEHTDSGLGAEQDYAYSSERSSDSTRYGTNKSSGASSGSHKKSGGGSGAFSNMMHQQSVSNNRKSSIYSSNRALQQLNSIQNPKYTPPAPVHNTTNNNNSFLTNNTNNNATNQQRVVPQQSGSTTSNTTPITTSPAGHQQQTNNSRLLSYTTFENNHYKFSLNNLLTTNTSDNTNLDSYHRPTYSSSPYYPASNSVRMSRGSAKSDIGVPIRRPAKNHLSMGNTSSTGYPNTSLYRGKSDLFLTYVHGNKGECGISLGNGRLYDVWSGNQLAQQQQLQQQQTAYHISGAQTFDLSPPLMYEQFGTTSHRNINHFDNRLSSTAPGPTAGPLIYIENPQELTFKPNMTVVGNITQNNPSCSETLEDFSPLQPSPQHNVDTTSTNTAITNVDHNINSQTKSSSLEIILTPIIQSSRRAQ